MYLNPMPATCRPWCSILWHQLPDSKLVHRCSLCERVRHDNTEQVPILLHGVSGKYPRTSTVNHRPDVYSYGKEAGTRSYKTSSRSFSPLPFLVCLFIHNHFLHIFFSQSATCIRCPTRMPFPTPSLSYPSHTTTAVDPSRLPCRSLIDQDLIIVLSHQTRLVSSFPVPCTFLTAVSSF
ncbi:hypothetical protein BCR44DRAFT_1426195, partial [Catenaria anguillulae PL171]